MSQNHFNYMQGVPVKIAENYKPPVKIAINQSVAQRLANASNANQLLASDYDFSLERTVLSKMSEWRQLRQHENDERKKRMQLRQEERQKLFDEKQKQLLTAVSYPSTDDLSSGDEELPTDDHSTAKPSSTAQTAVAIAKPIPTSAHAAVAGMQQQHFSPPNHFDHILVPTVMLDQFHTTGSSSVITPKYNKINYSDFENDTSSPFDNVELKTINDLDILAQILNTSATVRDDPVTQRTQSNPSKESNSTEAMCANNEVAIAQPAAQVNVNNGNNSNNIYHHQQQQQQQQHPQQTAVNHSNTMLVGQPMAIANNFYDQPLYNHQINENIYKYGATTECHQLDNKMIPYTNSAVTMDSTPTLFKPKNGQYIYGSTINDNPYASALHQNQYIQNYYTASIPTSQLYTRTVATPTVIADQQNSTSAKSKSKSVPDILQEINNELKSSQGKRVRNNSQCNTNPVDGKRFTHKQKAFFIHLQWLSNW